MSAIAENINNEPGESPLATPRDFEEVRAITARKELAKLALADEVTEVPYGPDEFRD